MKNFLKNQVGHLLFGFIAWLPIIIIAVMITWLFQSADSAGKSLLDIPLGGKTPPVAGFLMIILLLYFSGIVFKKTFVRNLASKIPVLGIFFGQNGKTITLNRLLNLRPCLFLYSPTCPSYGFIVSEETVFMDQTSADFVILNIYYPAVPTIVTGQIYPARKEAVMLLGNPADEIINMLLYALKSPEEGIKYLPWPDETKENFKQRAERFGLPNFKAQEN